MKKYNRILNEPAELLKSLKESSTSLHESEQVSMKSEASGGDLYYLRGSKKVSISTRKNKFSSSKFPQGLLDSLAYNSCFPVTFSKRDGSHLPLRQPPLPGKKSYKVTNKFPGVLNKSSKALKSTSPKQSPYGKSYKESKRSVYYSNESYKCL